MSNLTRIVVVLLLGTAPVLSAAEKYERKPVSGYAALPAGWEVRYEMAGASQVLKIGLPKGTERGATEFTLDLQTPVFPGRLAAGHRDGNQVELVFDGGGVGFTHYRVELTAKGVEIRDQGWVGNFDAAKLDRLVRVEMLALGSLVFSYARKNPALTAILGEVKERYELQAERWLCDGKEVQLGRVIQLPD